MLRLRGTLTGAAVTGGIFLVSICPMALGRDVKLTVYPQKIPAEAGKYSLVPASTSLTDGDALPLLDKALKALPGEAGDKQVRQYQKTPLDQLPADKVEQILKGYIEGFKYAAQAGKCRECRWPAALTAASVNVTQYGELSRALRLWVRYEIAQGNYEGAVLAMQTGIGVGRHFARGPSGGAFNIGGATIASMCRGIEELVQAEDAPNLYTALAAVPRPTPDVEKIVDSEKRALAQFKASGPPTGMTRAEYETELKRAEEQLKVLPEQLRMAAKRIDRDLSLIQALDAIRSYAASHQGQLPQTLAEITEVSVPKDPMSGEAFRYTRTGATAVLESPAPAGGDKNDTARYEITVKK